MENLILNSLEIDNFRGFKHLQEEFISFLGPQDDELWSIAQNAMQQAISIKCNFRPSYVTKAHLHTWLAWQEEPDTPMGQAITKTYVNANAPHGIQLITWFHNVFECQIYADG